MVGEIEIGEFYRVAWNSMPTADVLAAADQPAEAGGEADEAFHLDTVRHRHQDGLR